MLASPLVVYGCYLVGLNLCLRMLFASPARPAKRGKYVAEAAPSTGEGKLDENRIDKLKHVKKKKRLTFTPGTIWPPVQAPSSATNSLIGSTTASGTAAPLAWSGDSQYTVVFNTRSPNFNGSVKTGMLVYSDINTETGYWPLVSSAVAPQGGGLFQVTLVFRPYATAHSAGTGKGTIIITQTVSSNLKDFTVVFSDGAQFNLSNP